MTPSCSSKFPSGRLQLACSLRLARKRFSCTWTQRCLGNLRDRTANLSCAESVGNQFLALNIFSKSFFEAITFDSCFHSCRFRTVTSWRSLLLALVSAWAPRQWTRFVAPCLQKALSWLWWTRWALAQSFSRRLPSCLCG